MMRTIWKRAAAAGLALAMAAGFSGCSSLGNVMNMGGVSAADITAHVQGELDAAYLGQVNQDYLDVTEGVDESTVQEAYEYNLNAELEQNFAYIFEIDLDYTSQELKDECLDLLSQVYAKAKYEVKEATKNAEGNFMVEVVVEAVDTFAQVYDYEMAAFAEQWKADYSAADDAIDWDAITDEEAEAFFTEWENNWTRGVLDLCWEALPNTGYLDPASVVIQVKYNEDSGYYELVGTDWQNLDSMILAYSFEF